MSPIGVPPIREIPLRTIVNGKAYERMILPETLLLDFLRDELGLRGAKRSCDMEVCGACAVLVDGMAVSACTMLAADIESKKVETIEGLAENGKLHPLQQAFVDCFALQCGFCTSGLIMAALALLRETHNPDEETIRRQLNGNICRCTGYRRIIEAVRKAAVEMNGG
ncbi:MAG: (2Fe-2S)-binding protein [bacterium]|nr:(2Fe-2S)-binding protein [bacterium]